MKELEKIAEEFKRSAEVIRELKEKLKIAEDKARYWKDKYDKSLHDYLAKRSEVKDRVKHTSV